MMKSAGIRPKIGAGQDTVLLLEHDVIIRASLAQYLRKCGYRVLEAGSSEESLSILRESGEPVGVVLSGAQSGFRLSAWLKANRPDVRIILAATAERAAQEAAGLCDAGPVGKRPYDPQMLVQEIKSNLAKG